MTDIGFVIRPGEDIPEDVTRVNDREGNGWTLVRSFINGGVWQCDTGQILDVRAGQVVSFEWGQLTVTAVREPEPDEDLVHYRLPGATLTFCGLDPWDDDVSVTERAGSSNCRACRLTADEDERPAAEPHPAEVSLLDLVRQYGSQRYMNGLDLGGALPDAQGHKAAAEALFARIAALVAQQPAQAREEHGIPLFIHACGHVSPEDAPGVAEGEHYCFPACPTPGPWRPLLVGSDPAPESTASGPVDHWYRCDDPDPHPQHGAVGKLGRVRCTGLPQADLIAQVMAELGVDRPEEVLRTVKYFQSSGYLGLARERDEARAEVERLKVLSDEDVERASLVGLIKEALGVSTGGEILPAIDKLIAAQSGPLVLSLPEVPEGAVALVGSRRTYDRDGDRWIIRGSAAPQSRLSLGTVMAFEGSVAVEMAPPREPRTWPKLDAAPEDLLAFTGESGRRYAYCFTGHVNGLRFYKPTDLERPTTARPLQHWREMDGPLTEVLDEPDGAR